MKRQIFVTLLCIALLSTTLLGCGETTPAEDTDAQVDTQSQSSEAVQEQQSDSQSEVTPPPESSSQSEVAQPETSQSQATPAESSSSATQSEAEPPQSSSQSQDAQSQADQSQPPEQSQQAQTPAGPPAYLGVGAPSVAMGGQYLGSVEQQVLDGINAERAALGLAAVQWDGNLADAARIRSAELFANGYFAHERPDGSRWSTVLKNEVPVNYSGAGEILAAIETQQNPEKIDDPSYWVGQWVNSPAHYDAMVNGDYTHAGVGIAYAYDPDTGLHHGYATTIFVNW